MRRTKILFVATSCLLVAPGLHAQELSTPPERFSVTQLTLPGVEGPIVPIDLNDQGQIVLLRTGGGFPSRSFLWEDGEATNLFRFGSGFVRHEASGINEDGVISGSSWGNGFPAAAWQWSDGSFTAVGTLGGGNSTAFGLNENGKQTGWSYPPGPNFFAYIWDGADSVNLGTLPGGNWSNGDRINDLDQVAGYGTSTFSREPHAAIAEVETGMHSLGTLGGLRSQPLAINNAGQIIGSAHTGAEANGFWLQRAFVWKAGVMTELSPLEGDLQSFGWDINEAGLVVGESRPGTAFEGRAVQWVGRRVVDLNDRIPPGSGWLLTRARAVNDSGWILGEGLLGGEPATFLLTPAAGGMSGSEVR